MKKEQPKELYEVKAMYRVFCFKGDLQASLKIEDESDGRKKVRLENKLEFYPCFCGHEWEDHRDAALAGLCEFNDDSAIQNQAVMRKYCITKCLPDGAFDYAGSDQGYNTLEEAEDAIEDLDGEVKGGRKSVSPKRIKHMLYKHFKGNKKKAERSFNEKMPILQAIRRMDQ